MKIEQTDHDGVQVLCIHGEVDLAKAPELRQRLERIVKARKNDVVVDLSNIAYMDSSGIAVLIEAVRWAQKAGAQVVIASPSEQVRLVIELAKLEKFFTIEPTLEAALEHVLDR